MDGLQHIDVPGHQRTLGGDGDAKAVSSDQFQSSPGQLILPFQRIVGVAHGAGPHNP